MIDKACSKFFIFSNDFIFLYKIQAYVKIFKMYLPKSFQYLNLGALETKQWR